MIDPRIKPPTISKVRAIEKAVQRASKVTWLREAAPSASGGLDEALNEMAALEMEASNRDTMKGGTVAGTLHVIRVKLRAALRQAQGDKEPL